MDGVGDGSAAMASPLAALAERRAAAAASPLAAPVCNEPVGIVSVAEKSPLAWSADGKRLAAVAGGGAIYILAFDGSTFRMSKLLPSVGGRAIRALLWHVDNVTLVVAGMDGVVVWDVEAAVVTQVISHRTLKALGLPPTTPQVAGAHESDVESVCWAFDSTSLITGSKDTNVKVWDTSKRGSSWRLMETITGHKAPVLSVKFTAATARLATAGRDASIKIWDASTLALDWRAKRADDSGIMCTLQGTCESHGDVIALAWTPDGTAIVSGSRDNKVKMWSTTTFSETRDVFDKKLGHGGKHRSDVNRISFIPGASTAMAGGGITHHLATCSLDGTLRVWRVQLDDKVAGAGTSGAGAGAGAGASGIAGAGTGLDDLIGADHGAGAGISPAVSDVGGGWDEGTRSLLSEILGESTATATVRAGSAGLDANLSTQTFFGGDEGICEMEFNPVMPVVAIGSSANAFALLNFRPDTLPWLQRQYDGTLPPGSLPPGTTIDPFIIVQAFHGHTKAITAIKLTDDATVVSTSTDYTACIFDVKAVERRAAFTLPASAQCLAIATPNAGASPLIFVGCSDYTIRAFSAIPADYAPIKAAYAAMPVPTPVPPHEFEAARYVGHSGCVLAVTVEAKGRYMVSGGRDWSMLVWDLTRPTPALSRSPRDESGVPTGAPIARVDGHSGHVTALTFSTLLDTGSLLASAGNDHIVKVWKLVTGLTGLTLSEVWASAGKAAGGHASSVSALAWGRGTADASEMLFSGSWDGSIKVWSGKRVHRIGAATRALPGPGEDAPNPADVAPITTIAGHSARITGLDVSPAGDVIVSVGADYTAAVWRLGAPWSCIALCRASPSDGIFSSVSAGTQLFATGSDAGIMLWPLRPSGPFSAKFTAAVSAVGGSAGAGVGAGAGAGVTIGPGVYAAVGITSPDAVAVGGITARGFSAASSFGPIPVSAAGAVASASEDGIDASGQPLLGSARATGYGAASPTGAPGARVDS